MTPLPEQIDEMIDLFKENDIDITDQCMFFVTDGKQRYIKLTEYLNCKKFGASPPTYLVTEPPLDG